MTAYRKNRPRNASDPFNIFLLMADRSMSSEIVCNKESNPLKLFLHDHYFKLYYKLFYHNSFY